MNIDIVGMNQLIEEECDNSVFRKTNREEFFNIMKKSHIDLSEIVTKRKKYKFEPYHQFNFIVKELHEKNRIDVLDVVLLVEEEMMPIKDIVACLNEENLFFLKKSLAKKHNIKMQSTAMENFIYD